MSEKNIFKSSDAANKWVINLMCPSTWKCSFVFKLWLCCVCDRSNHPSKVSCKSSVWKQFYGAFICLNRVFSPVNNKEYASSVCEYTPVLPPGCCVKYVMNVFQRMKIVFCSILQRVFLQQVKRDVCIKHYSFVHERSLHPRCWWLLSFTGLSLFNPSVCASSASSRVCESRDIIHWLCPSHA